MMDTETSANYFASRFSYDPHRAGVWREIARFVENDLAGKDSILETGCGYGDFINQVGVHTKHAIDLNDAVREHLAEDVKFTHGDCTDLSFLQDETVQNVFAGNLLEHLDSEQLRLLLREIRRVLTPGGRLLLIQPNYRLCCANYFDDYTHVSVFSDISLCGFLSACGMKVIKCVPGILPFSMQSKAPKHPLLVRLYLKSPIRPFARQMYVVAEKPLEG